MINYVDVFQDQPPARITLEAWTDRFETIADDEINRYFYYHNPDWGRYLFPPVLFMVYGTRELKRLKFDNSFAALRMWGFIFNETERLFRAAQINKKIIATMGDLGILPVIVHSFPNCVPFYPECIWWTPFLRESTDLLDCATRLGVPEAACFSRAALAAFYKKAYFPRPDLVIASSGAACDDYAGVMQLIEDLGHPVLWLEVPIRKPVPENNDQQANQDARRFEDYLIAEYQRAWQAMVTLTGINNINRLKENIGKTNQLRYMIEEIKQLCAEAEAAPLPALEMMALEFGNLYGYADLEEWLAIVASVRDLVRKRTHDRCGVLDSRALPLAWITPSADPLLLNLIEDYGGRVVATEYVINQALLPIEENQDPFRALARAFRQSSLIGTTRERIHRIMNLAQCGRIRGVVVTNMLGASHCAMETRLIERLLTGVPVLTLDVPAPFGITEQIRTRLAAFMETLG